MGDSSSIRAACVHVDTHGGLLGRPYVYAGTTGDTALTTGGLECPDIFCERITVSKFTLTQLRLTITSQDDQACRRSRYGGLRMLGCPRG